MVKVVKSLGTVVDSFGNTMLEVPATYGKSKFLYSLATKEYCINHDGIILYEGIWPEHVYGEINERSGTLLVALSVSHGVIRTLTEATKDHFNGAK